MLQTVLEKIKQKQYKHTNTRATTKSHLLPPQVRRWWLKQKLQWTEKKQRAKTQIHHYRPENHLKAPPTMTQANDEETRRSTDGERDTHENRDEWFWPNPKGWDSGAAISGSGDEGYILIMKFGLEMEGKCWRRIWSFF
jgi:hypothetical protein